MADRIKLATRLTVAAWLGFATLVSGCVDDTRPQPPEVADIVFPTAPDEPRFVFERTIFSTANLKTEDGTMRLKRLLTGEQAEGRGFGKPFDVVSCKGRVYVSDTVERIVMTFDVPTRRFFEIGAEEPGALAMPLGLGVDDACNLYVADSSAKQVVVYDRDGRFLRSVGEPGDFHRLSHVSASRDGSRIYAVDTGGIDTQEHRVRVFDGHAGTHLFDIGKRGTGPGQFNLPRDIEVGPDGRVYVIDGANFRVQVFDANGGLLRIFGEVGRQTGQFSRPKGIALDPQGNIYVSDTAFGNFQIFNPDGRMLMFVGTRGTQGRPATYMLPAGIDVDEDGRVYMVDQFFLKVDVFRPVALAPEGGFLGAWNRTTATR